MGIKPKDMDVIMTERGAREKLMESVDIVSRLEEIKYTYGGEGLRKGIDI